MWQKKKVGEFEDMEIGTIQNEIEHKESLKNKHWQVGIVGRLLYVYLESLKGLLKKLWLKLNKNYNTKINE